MDGSQLHKASNVNIPTFLSFAPHKLAIKKLLVRKYDFDKKNAADLRMKSSHLLAKSQAQSAC